MIRGLAAATAVAGLAAAACWRSPPPQVRPSPGASPSVVATETATGPDVTGTFRWAVQEPGAIVPAQATGRDDLAVVDALFDSLTALDENNRPVPAAALLWGSDPSATRWTFTLRPGATFHDGTPVDAASVARGWAAVAAGPAAHLLADVAGAAGAGGGPIAGVRAVAPDQLEVDLVRPMASFPAAVAHPALAPLPVAAVDPDRPIGNGPFRAEQPWAHGRFIRLARFPGWANGSQAPDPGPGAASGAETTSARVDELLFQILDPDAAYLAFQQGRVDFTALPLGALAEAVARYGRSADGYDGPGVLLGGMPVTYHLAFTLNAPPFDDREVRRGLSLAIDRERLAAENLDGGLDPARRLLPPAVAGDAADAAAAAAAECAHCRYAPAAAEARFVRRGIDELPLTISRGGGHERIADALRRDLAAVGVRLRIRALDFTEFRAAAAGGEPGAYRAGWTADHPTPDDVLLPLLHTPDPARALGEANVGGYSAPDVDALLDAASAMFDPTARRALYDEAERLALNRDVAIVPLLTYRHRAVASSRVAGLRYGPTGRIDVTRLTIRDG